MGATTDWRQLNPPLSPWIVDAVHGLDFGTMTPVQASVIPLFLKHKDVVVEAVTGSGKTLAFLIPIIEMLLRTDLTGQATTGAMIIAPTRELATQIIDVLKQTLAYCNESVRMHGQLIIGGTYTLAQNINEYTENVPQILAGTPGRLNEFLSSSKINLKSLEVLVLDEADRLLDMGFASVLTEIMDRLPKQRRTGLFSATMSDGLSQIFRTGLRNPVKVIVNVETKTYSDKRVPASLKTGYIITEPEEKLSTWFNLLESTIDVAPKSIIYLSCCAGVDFFARIVSCFLPRHKLLSMHGHQTAAARKKNMKQFIDTDKPALMLTTDLAARGLDFPDVDMVLQIDPPTDPKMFSHRCGRAGRAGRPGTAIIMLNKGREEDYIEFLHVRKTPVMPYTPITGRHTPASVLASIREMVKKDRLLYDLGMKAYVSHVRAYSKHQASFIFRIKDLDFASLARQYALVKMPKMPELKGLKLDFVELEMNWNLFGYKDASREKKRLEALNTGSSTIRADAKRKSTPFSKNLALKERREERRLKRNKRRTAKESISEG